MKRVAAVLVTVVVVAFSSVSFAQEGPPPLPFKLLVLPSPRDPEVFRGDGSTHVAYELLLANFTPDTIRIDSLDYGAGSPEVSHDQLKTMYSAIGANPMKPQDPVLKPSEAGVIYVFLDKWKAAKWADTLTVEAEGKPQTRQTFSVDQYASRTKPVIISAPLRGNNWWTPNGPSNDSIHRRIIVAMGDHLGLPERFAVDWIQLGADGKSYTGPASENRSYHCYGTDILAAADGRVVSIKDGIPENVPNSSKMAAPITLDTIGGNYVMEDLGQGRYAFYAHLVPGSLTVKPGDQIKRGQVLGKLGNSGNSTEPHLHFHICDGPKPLFCNGLPFEIDHFTRYDHKLEMKGDNPVKLDVGAAHQVTDEIFMNQDLGAFP